MLTALSIVFAAMPFVVALLLGLALPLFALLLYRRFEAGLVLACCYAALDATFADGGGLYLGVNIYPGDVVYGLLLAVATARWLLSDEVPHRSRAWLLFAAMLVLALVLGMAEHGRRAAAQARETFYLLAAASYAMSFVLDELRVRRMFHAFAATALVILAVCVYRWAVIYLPIPDLLPAGGGWSGDGSARVVNSFEALLLAQWVVLGLFLGGKGTGALAVGRWLAPLLIAAVVVLQHRSVWIAALVGVVAAFAAAQAQRGSRVAQVAALLVAVALVSVPLVFSERFGGLSREIGRSAASALEGQGTVHARLQDWRQVLGDFARAGPRAWAFGQGVGRDPTRITLSESGERRLVRFEVHNHYLALLVKSGVIGLAAYLSVVLATMVGLHRLCRRGEGGWQAQALLVLLAMQMAYHVPYVSVELQHLWLGAAVAFVALHRRGRAEPQPAAPPQRPGAHDVAWR
jgi:O-Antigen ligase